MPIRGLCLLCFFVANFPLHFKRSFEENAQVAANKNQKTRKIFSPSLIPYYSITYKLLWRLLCLLWRTFFVEIAQVAPISRGHIFALSVSPQASLGVPATTALFYNWIASPASLPNHLNLPISPAEKNNRPNLRGKIPNSLWQNNLRKITPFNSVNLAYNSVPIR